MYALYSSTLTPTLQNDVRACHMVTQSARPQLFEQIYEYLVIVHCNALDTRFLFKNVFVSFPGKKSPYPYSQVRFYKTIKL